MTPDDETDNKSPASYQREDIKFLVIIHNINVERWLQFGLPEEVYEIDLIHNTSVGRWLQFGGNEDDLN